MGDGYSLPKRSDTVRYLQVTRDRLQQLTQFVTLGTLVVYLRHFCVLISRIGFGIRNALKSVFREDCVGGSVWGTKSSFGTLRRTDPRHKESAT